MIDGELGKPNDMHNGRTVFFQILEQLLGGSVLVLAAERKNHPPMAPLEITLVGTAAFLFQQTLLAGAELTQVCVAGDHDFFRIGPGMRRSHRNDAPNHTAIGRLSGDRLARIKGCILKKLTRRSRHDETVVRIIRWWFMAL